MEIISQEFVVVFISTSLAHISSVEAGVQPSVKENHILPPIHLASNTRLSCCTVWPLFPGCIRSKFAGLFIDCEMDIAFGGLSKAPEPTPGTPVRVNRYTEGVV